MLAAQESDLRFSFDVKLADFEQLRDYELSFSTFKLEKFTSLISLLGHCLEYK